MPLFYDNMSKIKCQCFEKKKCREKILKTLEYFKFCEPTEFFKKKILQAFKKAV